MARATRDQVRELARRVYGSAAEVSARRDISTWWRVEVFGKHEGERRLMLDACEPALSAAYGDVAARLRAAADRRAE